MEKKNKVLVIILIVIIVLLIGLCVLLATGTINFSSRLKVDDNQLNKKNDQTNINDNNIIIDNGSDVIDENNGFNEFIHTTSTKVIININPDYYEYAEISIEDGKLVAKTSKYNRGEVVNNRETEVKDDSYKEITKTFTIDGEKAKYITSMYYQPGANTYVLILTESGNVYFNNVVAINKTIDTINNFKKTEYSNVEEIKAVDNSDSKAPDRPLYYFQAIIDGQAITMNFKLEE